MSYEGQPKQKALLQKAMEELHKERGVSDGEVIRALNRWKDSDPKGGWPDISQKTYSRYRLSGVKSYELGHLIYTFLSRGPDRFRIISSALSGKRAFTADQKFVDSILTKLAPGDGGYRYEQIESMRYSYEFYRRSWRIPDGKHFVRSLLRIDKEGGVYRLTEVQKFTARGADIDQVDEGWMFPYSTNFFAMANSSACMKFYDFHELYPTPVEDGAVDDMVGNMIAVAGKGPHPSFRIWARRAKTGAVNLGHFEVSKFKDDESMTDILEYIMG